MTPIMLINAKSTECVTRKSLRIAEYLMRSIKYGIKSTKNAPNETKTFLISSLWSWLKEILPNIEMDNVMITHAGLDKDKEDYLKEQLKKIIPAATVNVTRAGSVIASHCGYGTVGILYIKK